MTGNNGGLDLIAALQHLLQDLLQLGEWRFSGNVISTLDFFLSNQCKRFADAFGSVMERRLKCELRIVQAIGVQFNFCAAGTASEEVHRASATDHIHGPLPDLWTPHSFDHHVRTAAFS